MLLEYVQAAMHKAKYEILPDTGEFHGHIPECGGVWACEATLEECREELQAVLEDWIVIKLRHNDADLPVIDAIDLNAKFSSSQEVA